MFFALAAASAFSLGGCSDGNTGADGKPGKDATAGTVFASSLSAADLQNSALGGKILNASLAGDQPVVEFQVVNKTTNKGVAGLRTFSLHIAQLKPEADGNSSYWQNYISDGLPLSAMPAATAAPINPSTDAVTSFNTDGTVKAQGYSVVDNNDGTYKVTFGANIKANTKVPYDASLVHRIGIGVRSVVVPGVVGKTAGAYAGPINPATNAAMGQFLNTNGTALVYDFVPATGEMVKDANGNQAFARDIVTIAACNQCHYKLEYGSNNTSGHFGSRPDTRICVMCHTNQLGNQDPVTKAYNVGSSGNFTSFIHQIHMGEELPAAATAAGINVNEFKYPQDVRNCTFCHKGADVDKWMSKPTINACGSCHNNIDFAAGTGHTVQANNSACVLCHNSAAVSVVHLPVVKPDPASSIAVYAGAPYNGVFSAYSAAYQANGRVAPGSPNSNTNAAYTAAASLSRLPAGAKSISYVINKVYRNSSKRPVMEFKFQVATADASGVLGTPVDVVFNDPAVKTEMIDGFVGSPSVYFAFAVPQDGITKPVDYNASVSGYLKRIWNGTTADVVSGDTAAKLTAAKAAAAATLSGPVSGYYTVTLTGVTIPDSAVMLTGGLGYTYGLGNAMTKVGLTTGSTYRPFATTTQPLTQTDVAGYTYTPVAGTPIGIGGLSVPAENKWKVATKDADTTSDMATGRRVITDNAKCNACHGRLGVKPTFHGGQRNDAPTCTFCHNVNRTNSGWAVNIKEDVHAIHAAAKRVNKFSWEATAGAKYWTVGYPGVLKNCEACHVAGFYDFSNSVYTANSGSIFDSMLFTTNANGTKAAINGSTTASLVVVKGSETIPATGTAVISPYIDATTVYGDPFAYNAATGVTTVAAATSLVSSPISSACYSCHDTALAKQHMVQNGGSIYAVRSAATLATKETCLVCHGSLSTTNITNSTTPTIKAVHRWW